MEAKKRSDRSLNGISCDVVTCEYHENSMDCMATSIEVKSSDPLKQYGVNCATYTPKMGR